MTVVVTGCAGFIGYHLSRALVADGVAVVGVDNLNRSYDPTLKAWRLADLKTRSGFQFVEADVTRPEDIEAKLGPGVELVYHLAARAGVRQSLLAPHEYVEANVQGAVHMLEWCRRHDVPRLFLASTSSLYGKHNALPFREDADTDLPLSPYAASKKGAEAVAASFSHLYGIHTPVARFFTVYGPAGRPDMSIFRFVQAISEGRGIEIHGDGTQRRDFTYVEDIVAGARTVAARVDGHSVVNLGSDAPVALLDVVQLIEKETGRTAKLTHSPRHIADVPATWADITKARALGWSPRTSIHDGIRKSVAWYAAERAWAMHVSTED